MVKSDREKILFVDDEESILEIVSEYFEQKGYDVLTAGNGREATEILKNNTIDCCFTDINMPEMDGLELAEHIRANDNTVPVIIMTGYPSIENTLRTLKNGVVDFLIKPVNLNQMELSVRRVLRQRQLFVENVLLKKEVEGKARLEKLNQELLYKVDELNTLNKIMQSFTTISSTADVFRQLVDMAIDIANADTSTFYVINDAGQRPFEVESSSIETTLAGPDNPGTDQSENLSVAGEKREAEGESAQRLIMEIVSDEIPLLISDNNGARGLDRTILSYMVVPLKIREKVFGVLTASVYKGEKRFTEKDLYYLSFTTQNAAHAIENLALYENIYENMFSTLLAFVKAVEVKDAYTQQHSNRVTGIACIIGRAMGCTTEELDILNFAGRLHDIGKIGIKDDILLKPGRLTDEEFKKIKEHPVVGASIVGQLGLWDREQLIIRHHHERFDGCGYPDGLQQEEIPLLARILSVADVYDALASDRPYRKKMADHEVLKIIREGAGTQFDPQIIDVFLDLYQKGEIPTSTDACLSPGLDLIHPQLHS
jgi:response regulator RpfG family c-di-GMP phosphodiesterase